MANLNFVGSNSAVAVAASYLERLSVGHVEHCIHRLVVADAFGVVAANNASQCFVECNVIFLYDFVVANDVDCCIGGNKCYFVYLFIAEEIVGNFDDAFATNFATVKIVANGDAVGDCIEFEHRYHLEGAARYASEVSSVPIINAGDGANQHPTQTTLDLYSIYKTQGTLENLNITMVGDLKYGRTVHSLLQAMSHFNPTFHFVAPDELKMPQEYKIFCEEHNIPYYEHRDFSEEVINQADILYMTRVQRERFTDLVEYERVKDVYILHNSMLANSKPNLRVLHPLPRVNEIAYDVDENPKAYYFQQAKNGLYARQAIICKVLGIDVE